MVLEHLAEMSKDDAEYLRETVQLKREWEDLSRKGELEERTWGSKHARRSTRNCFEYVAKRSRSFVN